LDGQSTLIIEHLRDLLVFAGVNNSSETEGTTLMIGRTEKQGLIWSRIDVFFQVINYLVVLGTFKKG